MSDVNAELVGGPYRVEHDSMGESSFLHGTLGRSELSVP